MIMRARLLFAVALLLLLPGCVGTLGLFGPGHSIRVEPLNPLVRPGSFAQLTVIRVNRNGTEAVANPRDYDWSSSNPTVGTMNRDGMFTAIAVGQTEIACIERGDKRVEAYIIATVDWSAP